LNSAARLAAFFFLYAFSVTRAAEAAGSIGCHNRLHAGIAQKSRKRHLEVAGHHFKAVGLLMAIVSPVGQVANGERLPRRMDVWTLLLVEAEQPRSIASDLRSHAKHD
jgi:hypothetical protein